MKAVKVQVLMNPEMVKRVDALASAYGVSRSALCAVYIGQAVTATESTLDAVDKLSLQMTGDFAPVMSGKPTSAG